MRQTAAVGALTLLIVVFGASAYEADVHYGLTKWLALQAGFNDEDAEIIASSDQSSDGQAVDAVYLVAMYACLKADQVGSRQVSRYHFPTNGAIPSPPDQRVVKPGSAEARREADSLIRATPDPAAYQGRLQQFGAALHTFQDSYSHRGKPDIPIPWICDSNLAWGHPLARGGWRSHDADLTYVDFKKPNDLDRAPDLMAEQTYALLCGFRAAQLNKPCTAKWAQLADQVDDFNKRRTKKEKFDWFNAYSATKPIFDSCDRINGIDLDDGDGWNCVLKGARLRNWKITSSELGNAQGPSDAAATGKSAEPFLTEALTAWYVRGDFTSVASKFTDAKGYHLPAEFSAEAAVSPQAAIARSLAGSVLVNRSHLEVLHRVPVQPSTDFRSRKDEESTPSTAEFREVYDANSDHVLVYTFASLKEALRPLDKEGNLYQVLEGQQCPDKSEERCTYSIFSSTAKPGDLNILIMARRDGHWRLVGHETLPME